MKIIKNLPFSLCMLISASAFAADNSDAVIMDASPCLDLVSAIERLSCFEEQANAAQRRGTSVSQQPAQSPSQVQPQPASETQQEIAHEVESASMPPADRIESDFGLPEKVNDRKEEEKANELIGSVAKIKELGLNRFLITLENGQVWEQMETKLFALDEGDEVRIYSSRWGSSYRLSSMSHRGFIQVQRLR